MPGGVVSMCAPCHKVLVGRLSWLKILCADFGLKMASSRQWPRATRDLFEATVRIALITELIRFPGLLPTERVSFRAGMSGYRGFARLNLQSIP
jgi:hypothetical protein